MRLRSLTIQGFKSFADKTVIEFQPGLNGIVGPNGCGKSNLVDALRWVMGEQGPRSMRGTEMADVLFGGSDSRAPCGFARVQMLLEPEDRDLRSSADSARIGAVDPAQEIEITRKLTRDGQSAYYLNRVRCRLRDITDLLLEAQLGSRDYSVIEQGKVDRILALKPQERLEILEEAAGVRRFQVQRERSEARLTRALDNLRIASGVLAEVEAQCRRLEQQAEMAKRYLDLADRLEQARASLYWLRSNRLRALTHDGEVDLQAMLRCEAESASAIAELRRSLEDAETRLRTQQTTQSRLEAEFRAFDAQLQTCRTERHLLAQTEPQLRAQIERALQEETRLSHRVEHLEAELVDCSGMEGELSERLELSQQDLSAAQTELEQRQSELQELQSDSVQVQQGFVILNARHATATGEQKRLLEVLERDERAQKRVIKSLEEVLSEERSLVEARTTCARRRLRSEADRLDGMVRVSALQQRQVAASARLSEAQHELNEVEKLIEGVSARKRLLEELARTFEGVGDGPLAVANWARARGEEFPLFFQLVDVPVELEPALAAALGDRLEAFVAPSLDWVLCAIDSLGEQLSPTCFIVRDRLPELPSDLEAKDTMATRVQWLRGADPRLASLLAAFRFVPDRAAALQLVSSLAPGQVVVTGGGESFDPGGLVSAGLQRCRAGLSLRRAQEALRLTEQLSVLNSRRSALIEGVRVACAEVRHLEEQVEQAQTSFKDAVAADIQAAGDLERLDFRLQRLGLDRVALEQQTAELATQVSRSRATLDDLSAEILALQSQIAESDQVLRDRLEELTAARSRVRSFEEDVLTARRLESRTIQERLRSVRARAADLQQRRAESKEEHDLRRVELSESRERLRSVQVRLHELAERESQLTLSIGRASRDAKDAAALCRAMAQVVAGIRSQIVEEDARRAQFRDEAARVRVQLAECQVALDRLQELRAGLSADRLAQAAQRLDSVEENALAVQIAELEPRQIALGNVNFAALEEFDDARRRLDSLEAQRTDLERSVSELRQAVSQLNQRASSQFREAFEAIRAQFRSLFAQVLAGGDADLGLFGSGIDAGVEIHAQPPGKKVRALDLLSGGEKALVTILLLVSMHRIRPSSLCILDEVDAALDDLNNQRFADLLAVLTKDSQVLVVTHSKQTIEACPTLYGVTMDEPGVSRLVSVRFDGPGKSHQS